MNEKLLLDCGTTVGIRTLYDGLKYLAEEMEDPLTGSAGMEMFFIYHNRAFSLNDILLSDEEIVVLKDAAAIRRQLAGQSIVQEIDEVVGKL